MGCSGEIQLHLSAGYSGLGVERISYRVALYPMKRPYTPIPRHQCIGKKEHSRRRFWTMGIASGAVVQARPSPRTLGRVHLSPLCVMQSDECSHKTLHFPDHTMRRSGGTSRRRETLHYCRPRRRMLAGQDERILERENSILHAQS